MYMTSAGTVADFYHRGGNGPTIAGGTLLRFIYIYSGYGKYSDPLKFFTLCYIAAIC